MIINDKPTDIATLSNVGTVSEFKIRNSAKAFSILSSGLYSNKIRAIVRELSCNALDSHVAANKADMPFDMHLPSSLNPYFSIRDYGLGLDHNEVISIYTTYFESTKTQSNDFIGALGLGSKSPFSYTDNFTITAIKDNVKRIYTAFINDHGVPSVAPMDTSNTTEGNGVEVRFAVTSVDDFYKFANEASSVLEFFKVPPNFVGKSVAIKSTKYKKEEIVPGVYEYERSLYNSRVIMGSIAYPIDLSSLRLEEEWYHAVNKTGFDFYFNLGELEVAASREELSLTPNTVQAIVSRIENVFSKYKNAMFTTLNNLTNTWDQANYIKNNIDTTTLNNYLVNDYLATTPNRFVSANRNYISFNSICIQCENDFNISVTAFSTLKYNSRIRPIRPDWENKIYISFEQTMFVINNGNKKIQSKVKDHATVNNLNNTFVILSPKDAEKPMLLKEFFDALYNPSASFFLDASNLSVLKKEKKEKNAFIEVISRNHHRWTAFDFNKTDDTKTYYYFPLTGKQVISSNGNVFPIKEFVEYFYTTSFCFQNGNYISFYGIPQNKMSLIEGKKNWLNAETFINSIIEDAVTSPKLATEILRNKERSLVNMLLDLDANKIMDQSIVNLCFSVKEKSSAIKIATDYGFLHKFDTNKVLDKASKIVQNTIDDIYKKYPMLSLVNFNCSNETKNDIVTTYINHMYQQGA